MSKKAKKHGGTQGGFDPAASKGPDSGLYHQISRKDALTSGSKSDAGFPKGKGKKKKH